MKEIPILFSTPMVLALLAGRKTQTRRILKSSHVLYNLNINRFIPEYYHNSNEGWCPYGKPGDIIWVRESFQILDFPDGTDTQFRYKADQPEGYRTTWKPSIHMPKAAARIWLVVTDIKVERVQDISGYNSVREGIEGYIYSGRSSYIAYKDYLNRKPESEQDILGAVESFRSLWQSINGEENWDVNPWVWVVSFRVLTTTGRPVNLSPENMTTNL